MLLNHIKEITSAKDCKCMILDSGLPRTNAHQFYENYGFEKGCYGFEFML